MLCQVCQGLDFDSATDGTGCLHHRTVGDLFNSADSGCELCAMMKQEIDHLLPTSMPGIDDKADSSIYMEYDPFYSKADSIHHLHFFQKDPDGWNEKTTLCYIAIFVDGDSSLSPFVPGRRIHMDSSSQECMTMARGWISGCLESHELCRSSSLELPILPTRVIDVGPKDKSREPFLFVSEGKRGHWLTLSHCWGGADNFRTTTINLEANKLSISMTKLPPLFRDAVNLTRTLGYQYLWIDSVCILQDSVKDWIAESSTMDSVYKNCVFTIGADSCPNSNVGIFEGANKTRNPSLYPVSVPVQWSQHNANSVIYPRRRDYFDDFNDPLNERGWALQEEILSPRQLRFASQAIRWECRSSVQTEEYPISANENRRTPYELQSQKQICLNPSTYLKYEAKHHVTASSKQDLLGTWLSIVWQFAKRQLTYSTDALPAISGVAREISKHMAGEYVAGVWGEHILECLLWYSSGVSSRSKDYTAPSWSWASLNMGLELGWVKRDFVWDDLSWLSEVKQLNVKSEGPDPFGRVSGGSITLTGPVRRFNSFKGTSDDNLQLAPLWSTFGDISSSICPYFDGSYNSRANRLLCFSDSTSDSPDSSLPMPPLSESAVLVQVSKRRWEDDGSVLISALLLEPCDEREEQYRRVGYASIPEAMASGWTSTTVSII